MAHRKTEARSPCRFDTSLKPKGVPLVKKTRQIAGIFAGVAIAATAIVPANAADVNNTYPETPKFNPKLPIIETTHGSDHIKANVMNPKPVCNAWEDYRTAVYEVTDNFTPAGTISTTNKTDKPVKLTQELSKTQSIQIRITGDRTNETSINFGGQASGKGSIGIATKIAQSIGGGASYQLSWEQGQTIGPYDVPAGNTGEATYGFRTILMTGTQQFCKLDGTWSAATPWTAFTPIKNEVRVKNYKAASDSWDTGKSTTTSPTDVNVQQKDSGDPNVKNEAPKAQASAKDAKAPAIKLAADKAPMADAPKAEAPKADAPKQEAPKGETPKAELPKTENKSDLAPYFTVSDAKAPGYAGLVGVRAQNVGTDDYNTDYPNTTFRIDVNTAEGPKNIDRLITPGYFNGAYTRDLGFNKKTGIRSFEVTLSNPVYKGKDVLLANLDFGDGATSLGRIKNYVTVTQTGRIEGDNSKDNDQNVDSRQHTKNDFGKDAASKGIF